jgi:hypothetical protein
VTKVRTRGIAAVSALLFKAGEYSLAKQLAYWGLSDPQIPDFARKELGNL